MSKEELEASFPLWMGKGPHATPDPPRAGPHGGLANAETYSDHTGCSESKPSRLKTARGGQSGPKPVASLTKVDLYLKLARLWPLCI